MAMIIVDNVCGKLISCKINDASFHSSLHVEEISDTAVVLIIIYHDSHDPRLASCRNIVIYCAT